MNYSEIFHFMRPELTLIVTIALLFLFDCSLRSGSADISTLWPASS